ncbi:MAG: LPS export ABC transporter ATP-binding protein [Fibrobacterota bacterium]
MKTVRTENLIKKYGKRTVVKKASISVNKQEIVGLLGPNGAGKTTTFYMIVGLIKPTSGKIYGDDEDLTGRPMYKRARKGIGYLAQEPSIFRKLSVEKNLLAILETMKIPKKQQREKAESLLEELKITHIRKSIADTLSGGERRRTEIARALTTNPDFLLLDEPFAGVDPIAVEDIQNIVYELKEKKGIGVLITDHNVRDTLAITDRAYIMNEGNILIEGTSEDLANNPDARRIYLGERFKLN